MHPCELPDDQLLEACDVRRGRRSGPGGQHRNKVESAIVLVHRRSGARGEATERRSQHENRRVAITRLRVNLALQLRASRPANAIPSRRWSQRCHGKRFRVSVMHDDFAPLLAEALDVIHAHRYDVSTAAERLVVSSSQLVRFLKLEPRALAGVNAQRNLIGLRPLK